MGDHAERIRFVSVNCSRNRITVYRVNKRIERLPYSDALVEHYERAGCVVGYLPITSPGFVRPDYENTPLTPPQSAMYGLSRNEKVEREPEPVVSKPKPVRRNPIPVADRRCLECGNAVSKRAVRCFPCAMKERDARKARKEK